MKSNLASKSESAQLLAEISARWGIGLPGARNLRVYHLEGGARLVDGGGFRALGAGGEWLPFLTDQATLSRLPSVTVDMGAVRFVCKGANAMRPGVRSHGEFGRGDIVCVAEESRGKFIAAGRASVASSEIGAMERGQVVENLHYVSDRHWEAAKGAGA